jgi:hypothetical protein
LSFNLAILLEDLEREEEAVVAYREALALDPALHDAHYNLSRIHERRSGLRRRSSTCLPIGDTRGLRRIDLCKLRPYPHLQALIYFTLGKQPILQLRSRCKPTTFCSPIRSLADLRDPVHRAARGGGIDVVRIFPGCTRCGLLGSDRPIWR